MSEIKTVTIPAGRAHEGYYSVTVRLYWTCPKCGSTRGAIGSGFSYDGSRRLVVNVWDNPCGHVDYYPNVREEAATNGLNGVER